MAGLFKRFSGIASSVAVARVCGGAAGLVTSASAEALKIGILLPGSVTDGGYNADGGHAAEALRSVLKADGKGTGGGPAGGYNAGGGPAAEALRSVLKADVKVTEGVPIANQADVYRQFATGGYTPVVG